MAQTAFQFDLPATQRTTDPAADPGVGFELGWDFAHFALTPPPAHLLPGSPLRQGWEAARASFGARTLAPTRHTRKWLQLRLNAWRRGRAFDTLQVTPNYLRQIDVACCPVTRERLSHASCAPSDASIDRVRNDAGYAAGNLAVMSTRANAAKGDADFDDALVAMRRAEAAACTASERAGPAAAGDARRETEGAGHGITRCAPTLSAAEWARVAVLCSFVTELPHAQAAALPLLVLPPNRLRLFNPVQALQALVTRQFARPGWSAHVARLAELLPGKRLRRDFHVFVNALVPRVLEAGPQASEDAMRWALEDAWRNPLVLRCWTRVALQIDAAGAERIVLRAGALRLGAQTVFATTFEQATEGWGLAQGGYARRDDATAFVPARRQRPAPRRAPGAPGLHDTRRLTSDAPCTPRSLHLGVRAEAVAPRPTPS